MRLLKADNSDRADRGGGRSFPIEPGIIARVVGGVKYMITGVGPATWFGPSQPLPPSAQEVKGRIWDYPVGYNLHITKRPYEGISFEAMRALADNYDVLRLVIETRKDQIARMKWKIKGRPGLGSLNGSRKPTPEAEKQVEKVTQFLIYPDQEHNWDQWLRMILEDMLVIDAAAIYPRKTVGGQPYAFEIFDGATITRKINADGRTPGPPDVAYQQILKGLPAVDFSRDELVYLPRNPRTNHVYGYSPVEQIIRTINIGLRRMVSQLEYYREGNIPEALIGVPKDWTIEQIAQFQGYWDDILEGNLAQRRHAKFVPGEMTYQETKAPPLKDEFDEWLARVVCYAFSVSPQPFVKEMNRATAQSSTEMAQQEGLEPLLQWTKNMIDILIWKYFAIKEVEFVWEEEIEPDALKQAQINQIYVSAGILEVNEVRDMLGFDPLEEEEEDDLLPIGKEIKEKEEPELDEDGNPIEEPEPTAKLAKRKKKIQRIDRERGSVIKARAGLKKVLLKVFKKAKTGITRVEMPEIEIEKADEHIKALAKKIIAQIELMGFAILLDPSEELLEEIAKDGVHQAMLQLGMSKENMTEKMSVKAVEYAKNRAAELVGKRRLPDGTLIDNPNRKWAIEDTTRDLLRGDVTKAVEEGWSTNRLRDALEENFAFSADRAEMIARTEIAFADVQGNAIFYKESGVVSGKEWILATNHPQDDECDDNVAAGIIDIGAIFPSGDEWAPSHPNCLCETLPVLAEAD